MKPLVIIESPFAGDVERNRRYLSACLRDSLLNDEAPFASHAIYTLPGVLNDFDAAQRELGIWAGWAIMHRAQFVAVYQDLGISPGMRLGIEQAERLGLAVRYRFLAGEWSEK